MVESTNTECVIINNSEYCFKRQQLLYQRAHFDHFSVSIVVAISTNVKYKPSTCQVHSERQQISQRRALSTSLRRHRHFHRGHKGQRQISISRRVKVQLAAAADLDLFCFGIAIAIEVTGINVECPSTDQSAARIGSGFPNNAAPLTIPPYLRRAPGKQRQIEVGLLATTDLPAKPTIALSASPSNPITTVDWLACTYQRQQIYQRRHRVSSRSQASTG